MRHDIWLHFRVESLEGSPVGQSCRTVPLQVASLDAVPTGKSQVAILEHVGPGY